MHRLKSLIHDRQTAFARGDEASFLRLRNRANRLRKSCRAKYYESKVKHLRDCALSGGMKLKGSTRCNQQRVLT